MGDSSAELCSALQSADWQKPHDGSGRFLADPSAIEWFNSPSSGFPPAVVAEFG